MKNLRKLSGLALALLGGAPGAVWAQMAIPAAPAAAFGAPPLAAGAAPVPVAAAAAPPRNIWSFLCLTPEQKAACKAKFCASQFGRLISNTMAPMSAFTGGVISQPCPLIDPAGLAADPTSALGAASQVQKDTAEAAARRVAIRYISTANCNWWPEVQAALANTLRTDRNECVRLEAALALQRGCCCNRITIKALVNSLSVFPDDSNPREDSPRVRGAAMAALQHCLACFVAIAVPPPPPPEKVPAPAGEAPPPALKGPGPLVPAPMLPVPPVLPVPPGPVSVADGQHSIRPASYRNPAPEPSMEQLVQKARRVLQQAQQQMAQNQRPNLIAPFPANDRCLLAVIEDSLHPSPPKQVKNNRIPSATPAAGTGGTMVEPPMLQPVPRFAPAPLSPQSRIIPVPVAPVSVNESLPTALPSTPASRAYAPNRNAPQPASSSVRIGAPQLVPPTPKLPETADYEIAEPTAVKPTKGIIWEESDSVANPIPPQPLPTPSASAPAAAKPAEPYAGITASQTIPVVETPSQQETAVLPVSTASSQPPSIYQLLEMLKNSPQPKMRQWAARSLTRRSGPTPNVVHALLSGAAKDASTDVRDTCLQGLLQLGVYDPALLAKVDWPKIDSDPRVREAVWRLVLFGTAVPGDQVVHDAARALNQWLQSRSPTARPSRS